MANKAKKTEKLEDHYVAEGFDEDAKILLQQFVELKSTHFRDFAPIWRSHHFSLVFMGRPDDAELNELTNEIFRLTTLYLTSSSSYYLQIGAIYLLYGLFRNQISQPPVMIRLKIEHWDVVKSLFLESMKKKLASLYYVINYLRENAFVYVENQMLRSPLVGMLEEDTPRKEETVTMSNYKSPLEEYSATNRLAELADIHAQYLEAKKNLNTSVRIPKSDLSKFYTNAIKKMNEILNPDQDKPESLGDRRAKLKAEAFKNKAKNHLGISSDEDTSETDPDYIDYDMFTRRRIRSKRPPGHERKVGRPRKQAKEPFQEKDSDDEPIDFDRLKLQQSDFYLPPVNPDGKKCRAKRIPYYQTSPKREDSDSDSD